MDYRRLRAMRSTGYPVNSISHQGIGSGLLCQVMKMSDSLLLKGMGWSQVDLSLYRGFAGIFDGMTKQGFTRMEWLHCWLIHSTTDRTNCFSIFPAMALFHRLVLGVN